MKKLMSDIHLGDTVQVFEGSYGCATVSEVCNNGDLTLFRPYTHISDTAHSGNDGLAVICYVGSETVRIPFSKDKALDVIEARKDPIR